MRSAVFLALQGNIFTFVKEKLDLFSPAVFSCKKTLPLSPTCPPSTTPGWLSHASGSCRVRGYPLRHEASAGGKGVLLRVSVSFYGEKLRTVPRIRPVPQSRAQKNGRRKKFLLRPWTFQKMVRPGGVEPSTKSLEGSCSIQLSYGRTAVRLLTIDTVLRSVSRAQAGCGTAPGAVQDRRKKG